MLFVAEDSSLNVTVKAWVELISLDEVVVNFIF